MFVMANWVMLCSIYNGLRLYIRYIDAILTHCYAGAAVQSPGGINISVWFTFFGVASSFISTFFAFSYVK